MRAVLVSTALISAAAVYSAASHAQGARYEVKPGDSLLRIARKARHPGTNTNQMFVAIVRANKDSLAARGVHFLKPGQVLTIPEAAQVSTLSAADARREVVAILKESPLDLPRAPTASIKPTIQLTPDAAARRYSEALEFEKSGKHDDALKAFLEAGENGHGQAQLRLGQIYDRGNSSVKRDYQTALFWYGKAREQGVAVPKPTRRAPQM